MNYITWIFWSGGQKYLLRLSKSILWAKATVCPRIFRSTFKFSNVSWEGMGARGKGDNRGWDGWMVSPTRWTWVWVNSRRWWWTGKPGVLQFMGSQRVGHEWATDLIWYIFSYITIIISIYEKGMANHFSILALRTPWTVWKGKMIGYWKRNSPGQ